MQASRKLANKIIFGLLAPLTLLAVIFWAPGANAQSGNVYGSGQAQIVGQTQEGIVLQVSFKKTGSSQMAQATGTGLGAMIGGLLGNAINDNNARGAAAALGSVLGGIGGNFAADALGSNEAQEIVVGVRNAATNTYGSTVVIVQPAPFSEVQPGDLVLLSNTGGSTRVIKMNYKPVS